MVSKHNLDEKTLTLCVPGDLVSTNVEALRTETGRLLGTASGAPPPWNTLVLELTNAKMVDSAGLNLIVSVLKRVQLHGAQMQVIYSDPNILRTLTFTRLDKHVGLVKAEGTSGPAKNETKDDHPIIIGQEVLVEGLPAMGRGFSGH